jgi:hypothetical protein
VLSGRRWLLTPRYQPSLLSSPTRALHLLYPQYCYYSLPFQSLVTLCCTTSACLYIYHTQPQSHTLADNTTTLASNPWLLILAASSKSYSYTSGNRSRDTQQSHTPRPSSHPLHIMNSTTPSLGKPQSQSREWFEPLVGVVSCARRFTPHRIDTCTDRR